MELDEKYDVVVGVGGAAGLSAALVLGRCRRSVVVREGARTTEIAAVAQHRKKAA